MIAARTLKSKEAIDELIDSGENMEDIEIAASNAEKALNSIGLSARNSNGDFKDLEVILGEVAGKWDTLNNSTKQYVSEQLAGNNRRSFSIGLMENYDRTMELQQIAENSSGQLMEASEKKAESLEGRLNKLQNAWTGLYQSMLNSDFTKGAISGLTDIINGVSKVTKVIKSTLIPTLTLATAAWVAYKIAMIEASGGFVTFGGMVAPLIGKLTTLKTTLIATTQAILGSATAMTVLGGAVAGLAVFGIAYNYGKKLQEQMDAEYYTTEELSTASETLTNKMNALADAKDRLATTSADLDVLEVEIAKMNSANTSLEHKQKLYEDINSKIKQYANEYPDLRGILLDENRSYQDRIEYLERTLELEKDIAAQEAQKTVQATSMSDYETKINEGLVQIDSEQIYGSMYEEDPVKAAEWQKQKLSEMMTVYAEATNRALELKTLLDEGLITQEYYDTEIASLQRLEEALMNSDWASQIFGDNFKGAVDDTIEYTKQLIPSLQSVFDGDYNADSYTDALNDLNEAMKDTEFSVADTEEALKILTKVFPELEGHVDDLSGVIDYLGNQAMLELAEQADQANSILSEMASEDFTGFDTSSAQELLTMYPELANHIQDAAYVQDFLNGKVREYQDEINGLAENGSDAWGAYYDNVLAQDAEFWNSKLANSDQWAEYEKLKQQEMQEFGANILGIEAQDFADYIDAKGGFRTVDYTNCENAAQAEAALNSSLVNDMIGWFASYITEKGSDRQTDMTNVVAFLNQQGVKEAQTIDELKTMWASYYNAKKAAVNAEISELNKKIGQLNNLGRNADSLEGFEDMIMGTNGVSGAAKHQAASLAGKLTQLERDNTNLQNFFATVDSTFGSIGDGLSQISATADEISNTFGGGGSGFKPKSTGSGSGNKGGSGSGGSGGRGGSGSGGSGSGGRGGSSATEKEVEDLDLRIDKYTELEEAIKRAEEALSRNQEAQEAVTTKPELKKLLEQEIELMNKKKATLEKLKQAQIKEQQSLKSYLQRAGLIFNGDELVGDKVTGGSVTDRLKDAQNWANKASGAEKEWRIKDTQYLKEQIDTYYDLMNSIGSTQGSLNDLNLEIRNAKKEHEELLKAVENLSDRYLQITMRLERLNSELSINQRKQELAVGQELVSLRNRELQILKEKKALNQQNANELKEEQKELQDYLYKAGLRFAKDGTMTNYDQLWAAATKKYNGLAGTAAEDYKEFLDEIAEKTDRYLEILNSELPQVEEDLLDILQTEKELAKQQEEYAEQLRDLAYNYDYLFQVTQKLTKAEQELSLLESKMEHASYEERLDILERQEEIYKSQLKLLEEQKRIQESMNLDRRNDLMKIGFEFDDEGFIKNYDEIIGAMYDKIQSTEGGAVRDEMIENYDELISKIEEYNNSLSNIRDSEQTWLEMNNAIKNAQQEQLDLVQEVQDSIADAITNKWEETTDNLKKELEKQKELLNKQWEEEDWEDELTDAQDELNKIQAQINNLSKDTSLAGQLKLEQLKEDYKTQLEAMNEMIKQHEREMTNQVFEDESQRLDDQMEEALKTEQLMQSVNQALSTGFVTIGEQAIKLNDLLVDQLKEAKELWGDIASLGQAITNKTPSTAQLNSTRKTSSTVNTNAPLINVSITGDLDSKITLDDINRITKQASEDVMVKLYELMK